MAIKIQGTEVINNNREADFYRYVKISGGDDPRIEIGPENGETQSFSIRHANNRLEFGQHDGTNNYNQVNIDSTGQLNARVGMSIQGGALELNGAATKTFSIKGTNTAYSPWTDDGWAGGSVTNWNSGQNVELELKVKQSLGQDLNYGHTVGSSTDTGFETKGFTHIGGITLQWGCTGFLGDIGQDHLEAVTFAIPWEGITDTLPEVMSITTGMISDRDDGWNDNIDGTVGIAELTKTGFNFRFDEWGSVHQNINFCYQAIGHTDLSYVDHHN